MYIYIIQYKIFCNIVFVGSGSGFISEGGFIFLDMCNIVFGEQLDEVVDGDIKVG